MRIDDMLELLNSNTYRIAKLNSMKLRSHEFTDVIMFVAGVPENCLSDEVALFASAAEFNRLILSGKRPLISFLYEDEEIDAQALRDASGLVLAYSSHELYLDAFRKVFSEFQEIRRMQQRISSLSESVSRGDGLASIANQIADMYDAAVSITDSTYSVLATSDNFVDFLDPIERRQFQRTHALPGGSIARLKEVQLLDKRSADNIPIVFEYVDSSGQQGVNHLTFITIESTPVGSFSLLKRGEPLPTSRMRLLTPIAHILSAELQKIGSLLMNKSMGYSHIIARIRDGRITADDAASMLADYGYVLKRYKRVIYVDLLLSGKSDSAIQTLAERIRHTVDNSVYAVFDSYLFVLTSDDVPPNPSAGHMVELGELLRASHIKAGISAPYTDLLQTPKRLESARRAIEIGSSWNPGTHLYSFEHYQTTDLFEHVGDQGMLELYLYQPYLRLLEEDADAHGNLVKTLLEYLDNPAHPDEVCRKLFIHRNTLRYRLNRAQEIMGVDIRNGKTIMHIQLSVLLLKWLGRPSGTVG